MENFKHDIFEQMGNLFYAIALDQHVEPLQFGELKMLLRKDWLDELTPISTSNVTEASHLVSLKMDTLQAESATAEDAFNEFTKFYATHREQFSAALKEKIGKTAEAITEVFPLEHNIKNNHITKLKMLLENSSLVM